MEQKAFRLQVKSLAEDGTFEGYASVFGNVDAYGEVVERGAFARTLDHWRQSGRPIPVLWQHRPAEPVGITLEAAEDEHGLRVKGRLILETTRGREAYALLKAGALGGLSIGYDVIKDAWENGIRRLKELRLWEYSLVTFPANPDAVVIGVKGVAPRDVSEKLAPEGTPWSKPSLRDFTEKPWEELSAEEKRRIAGHYAWAPKVPPEKFTDLKLPHHRPSDGAVVWRGVRAAMAVLFGARGGVDIPTADRRMVYDHLARHYRQFGKEPPEFRSYTPEELREIFPELDPMRELATLITELKGALQQIAGPGMAHPAGAGPGAEADEIAAIVRELKRAAEEVTTWT